MRLREQIVKANLLVREASYIAEELDKRTEYKVTLQIPASSLDANRKVRLTLMKTKISLDKTPSYYSDTGVGGLPSSPSPAVPVPQVVLPFMLFLCHPPPLPPQVRDSFYL